ncbi:MAG: flagellar basal body P-ring formation protein FlgA [Pirellulales bacterium]|nr:flagellar basal body P-ring formation protein FlgA [Pirellulales bacterium]
MSKKQILTLIVIGTLAAGTWCQAAEVTIRGECEVAGAVVTLGDVARIASADPDEVQRLSAMELFPTPAGGRQRFVRQREIQDVLLARGVHLGRHRFSGSSQVTVRRAAAEQTTQGNALAPSLHRRMETRVSDAIVEYLRTSAGDEPWMASVQLTAAQSRLVSGVRNEITVSGGQTPWLGNQTFEVTVNQPGKPAERFSADARVTLPAAMVVTNRALHRGEMISPSDVRLERLDPAVPIEGALGSLDEVVGQETTRAIPEGKPVVKDSISAPLLVRRGEIVTVTASSGGVRVTTNARAKADGSKGELVAVESLHDRSAYFARVSGLRAVEVFAGVVRTAPSDTVAQKRTSSRNAR